MIFDILGPSASIVLIAFACCVHHVRPVTHGGCPSTMFVNGIRPSGFYQCLTKPGGNPADDGTFGHPDRSYDRDGELYGHIWCSGGSHPIVVDDHTVGCTR